MSLPRELREAIVHHLIGGMFVIHKGKWKLVVSCGSEGRTKVDKTDENQFQFFNMEADVRETKNIHQAHPDIVEKLTTLLEKYKSSGRSTPDPV